MYTLVVQEGEIWSGNSASSSAFITGSQSFDAGWSACLRSSEIKQAYVVAYYLSLNEVGVIFKQTAG